ncbi:MULTISPECIES: cytochrome c [Kuenenia]|uniref:Cytochrome c n=1 Tax=Kuenenia stuttgartiensis TaxID=174633 RepID=A0A2C9CAZ0_KUEST|nr:MULTISPECIES: cytochrome c [Kuenenia]MBE7547114.1 cytochrome c [Planctomycetia bacterium]MCL4726539.1 cytochrome c [Candidatus Kuenenia stuttgartiensis]MCZ7621355.1 cytochrome c [Candidatus Kuenenia sp.]SOH02825.1 hypothetical protein KSMBR1_0309 [Candidatus Kuenenia stuttgartiensis]
MGRVTTVKMGLVSFFGIVGMLNFAISNHTFGSEGQIITHEQTGKHEGVNLPVKTFTRDLEHAVNNILEGILKDDFNYIKQEADHISEKSKSMFISFFENSNRFRKVEENPARDIQKKDFANYVDEINKQVASLKKAADSQDSDQLLSAFTGLLKNACINCHTKYRK